jgi:aminopeptidase N
MSEFKHLYDDFKPENYKIFLDVNRKQKDSKVKSL